MTTKEAIKLIQRIEEDGRNVTAEHVEALGLAIKALMAYRDCKHCTHNIKVGNLRGCALWDCDFEDARGETDG